MFGSSFDVMDFFPRGDALVFLAALTGGDDDAPRFRPAFADPRAPLRGDGVFFGDVGLSSSASVGATSETVGLFTSSAMLASIVRECGSTEEKKRSLT